MDNDKHIQVISEILTVFYNHKLTFKQAYTALDDVKEALEEVKNETKIIIHPVPFQQS